MPLPLSPMVSTLSYVEVDLPVTVCSMLYVVPPMSSGEPSFIHVTVVAGEPVEVQVSVNESGSKVRLVMLGGANKTMRYQRSDILVDADNQVLM